jgi:Uri superfamily endonuclease
MELPEAKGTYILIASVAQVRRWEIGSLGKFDLIPGFYAYVGSAFGAGGLRARLGHHLAATAEPHWHIDYLLQKAQISSVIISESEERNECVIAKEFMNQYQCILGFGSSDCKCTGHLFILKNEQGLESKIVRLLRSVGFVSSPVAIRQHILMGSRRQQPLR